MSRFSAARATRAARALAGLCVLALGGLSGCAAVPQPSIRLALDGPPLQIRGIMTVPTVQSPGGMNRGENAGEWRFEGLMDRHVLAGLGRISLNAVGADFSCAGLMDSPPSEKGRLYAELSCSDGATLHLLLRNVGPDQGLGIGRFTDKEPVLELFYHPDGKEAARRLETFREEMALARDQQK